MVGCACLTCVSRTSHIQILIDLFFSNCQDWLLLVLMYQLSLCNGFVVAVKPPVDNPKFLLTRPFCWLLYELKSFLKVHKHRELTDYETCAYCTGFVFCTFPVIIRAEENYSFHYKQLIS